MAIAVYPGTFDPLTRGHEDIVRRAASIFGRVVVGVAGSRAKGPIFTQEERMEMARGILAPYPNVHVAGFSGLLRDFVRSQNAGVIVRGLRAVADFEYEFQMAGMNRYLLPDVDVRRGRRQVRLAVGGGAPQEQDGADGRPPGGVSRPRTSWHC